MHIRQLIGTLAGVALCATLAGCAHPFEPSLDAARTALSVKSAETIAATADISALSGVKTADAARERQPVLQRLRGRGPLGMRAAELLTAGFPRDTAAIPVLVRACTMNGADAILIVEASGDAGGALVHRRLWVFDRSTGALLRAASIR